MYIRGPRGTRLAADLAKGIWVRSSVGRFSVGRPAPPACFVSLKIAPNGTATRPIPSHYGHNLDNHRHPALHVIKWRNGGRDFRHLDYPLGSGCRRLLM